MYGTKCEGYRLVQHIQEALSPCLGRLRLTRFQTEPLRYLEALCTKNIALGVYCGLGLDGGVCGGTEGGGGGRGMVVLATSCCYLEHNVL